MNKTNSHLLDICKIPNVHYKRLIYAYFKVCDNICVWLADILRDPTVFYENY